MMVESRVAAAHSTLCLPSFFFFEAPTFDPPARREEKKKP